MTTFPTMEPDQVDKVRRLEGAMSELPQVDIPISHHIHGGLYARTAYVPAGVAFTGAMMTEPMTVIVCGDVTVYIGDKCERLQGYHVIAAEAGRKQAFLTHCETVITALFPTSAETVEEAEELLTCEPDNLQSRKNSNVIILSERAKCLS